MTHRISTQILVVDDNPRAVAQIKGYAAELGACCEAFNHPSDALRHIAASSIHYDLIFVDFLFGVESHGLHAGRMIQDLMGGVSPTIIGMTGSSSLYYRAMEPGSGFEDVIMKPLPKWLIMNLIAQHKVH